jgi:hypothetical protein
MKNNILHLLIILLLLQSCYSYKAIDIKKTPLVEGKTYEFKVEKNKNFEKITLKSFNDSIMNVKIGNKEKQITISDIKSIKVRKISVIKTIGFPITVAATLTFLFTLSYSGPQLGEINFNKIKI